jgi:hypothetical protein
VVSLHISSEECALTPFFRTWPCWFHIFRTSPLLVHIKWLLFSIFNALFQTHNLVVFCFIKVSAVAMCMRSRTWKFTILFTRSGGCFIGTFSNVRFLASHFLPFNCLIRRSASLLRVYLSFKAASLVCKKPVYPTTCTSLAALFERSISSAIP